MPRSTNKFVDAMASIGSLIPQDLHQRTIHIEIIQITKSFLDENNESNEVLYITIEDKNLWHIQLAKFLRDEVLPQDLTKSTKKAFKLKASHYCMLGDVLYHQGFDGILLRCL